MKEVSVRMDEVTASTLVSEETFSILEESAEHRGCKIEWFLAMAVSEYGELNETTIMKFLSSEYRAYEVDRSKDVSELGL